VLQAFGGLAGASVLGAVPTVLAPGRASAAEIGPITGTARETEVFQRRVDAATLQGQWPIPTLACNGDDDRYPNRIGSFSKTLPHNSLGEVDPAAYDAFLTALASGDGADFDLVPAGGGGRLANPRAAYAFPMTGADSHKMDMPAVHAFDSARQAAEAGEVYWMALTREVRFDRWDNDPLILAAAEDISSFSDFTGPKVGGQVTPGTLFRGQTPGDLAGPYVSQFLYLDVPYGNRTLPQKANHPVRGDDYMTDYASWLAVQRGQLPSSANNLRPGPARYILRPRDLGEYVHRDFSYQAYLNATLICLSYGGGALDPNPYSAAAREGGFVTFGPAGLLDWVARSAVVSLRVAWFHKWLVHRKLRPEAFGGRLHNHLTGAATYPIHPEILNSPAMDRVFYRHGTYLLPQAFPEGSPTHPSYPAGHATIAGACVTVLKAFFDEDFAIPEPVVPRSSGLQLKPYTGDPLTLGGELNKLASNIALARNYAGVHWRADGDDGLVAGENVALTMLQDHLRTVVEDGAAFVLTRFDGTRVMVTQDDLIPV
jgi:membrane-associated phospholipid phosphatase